MVNISRHHLPLELVIGVRKKIMSTNLALSTRDDEANSTILNKLDRLSEKGRRQTKEDMAQC